jgi:hypothetical protein
MSHAHFNKITSIFHAKMKMAIFNLFSVQILIRRTIASLLAIIDYLHRKGNPCMETNDLNLILIHAETIGQSKGVSTETPLNQPLPCMTVIVYPNFR